MENNYAIKVENLSKAFKLPHERYSGLKQSMLNLFNQNRGYEIQQVLNDISFEIKKGEFFGIVGRNGSGKSTLLKLLAGIYTPDKGHIQVNGSLTPFIELGVGFNPELSGRENLFMNGALLGFNRSEMEGMYDDIVEFAELEKFMDQKLKNYSSGMQVRLAFSIAIRAQGDILLLDEVLAVGDEAFQKKCMNYFYQLKRNKKTVILVTHNMSAVESYCDRALLIQNGVIKDIGTPTRIAQEYSGVNSDKYIESRTKEEEQKNVGHQDLEKLLGIKIEFYQDKRVFTTGQEISLGINWKSSKIKNLGVALFKQSGEYIYGTNTFIDKIDIKSTRVNYKIKADINEGEYRFLVGFFGSGRSEVIYFAENNLFFSIKSGTVKWGGLTKLGHEWYSQK